MFSRNIHMWITSCSVQISPWPVIWCTSPLTLLKVTKNVWQNRAHIPCITNFLPVFSASNKVTPESSLTLFPPLLFVPSGAHCEVSGFSPSWIHPLSFWAFWCSGAGLHNLLLKFWCDYLTFLAFSQPDLLPISIIVSRVWILALSHLQNCSCSSLISQLNLRSLILLKSQQFAACSPFQKQLSTMNPVLVSYAPFFLFE